MCPTLVKEGYHVQECLDHLEDVLPPSSSGDLRQEPSEGSVLQAHDQGVRHASEGRGFERQPVRTSCRRAQATDQDAKSSVRVRTVVRRSSASQSVDLLWPCRKGVNHEQG